MNDGLVAVIIFVVVFAIGYPVFIVADRHRRGGQPAAQPDRDAGGRNPPRRVTRKLVVAIVCFALLFGAVGYLRHEWVGAGVYFLAPIVSFVLAVILQRQLRF